MSYCRFVPGFTRHPKRLKCGPISSWLWICSVDYCMEHLTDGFLDEAIVAALCSSLVGAALKRAVDNLVAVGSWDRVDGGFQVRGYLKHNLSKVQVEHDISAARQRYLKRRAIGVSTPTTTPGQRRDNAVPAPELTELSVSQSVSQVLKPTTSKGDSRHQPTPIKEILDDIAARHPELEP